MLAVLQQLLAYEPPTDAQPDHAAVVYHNASWSADKPSGGRPLTGVHGANA
jgi:hypothetical protein